ncbi:hypothetical protein [Maricaulis parjimensis]|uniref:hypothetical protein n=1 Tax=Maricaulis parjimensis TaxID=144023 RepID=UPI00193AAF7A|nr:hypothetical protein [Maricaulis parjimensis]
MSEPGGFDETAMADGRVLVATLRGETSLSGALSAVTDRVERIRKAGNQGLVMDYSGCTLTHPIEEYSRIADTYCDGLPDGFPVAFVYNENQIGRCIYMTRRLEAARKPSRAFPDADAAVEWVTGVLDAG